MLEERFGAVYSDGPGMPPLPTWLMAGLALCLRWVENPYFQSRTGETFFCHALPFDRSSMTRWRRGADRGAVAGKLQPLDPDRGNEAVPHAPLIVDTTVQPKSVMFSTDAKLIHRARERLVRLAKRTGLNLRQSYVRIFTSGQKRRVTPAIRRQMRRCSGVEPVIGQIKAEHRMGRIYLAGQQGDALNPILAAAGYDFSLLLG